MEDLTILNRRIPSYSCEKAVEKNYLKYYIMTDLYLSDDKE